MEETLRIVLEDMSGFKILSWQENPGVRLKIILDSERFFIVSVAKYGERKQSKVKQSVKFDLDSTMDSRLS